MKKFTFFLLVAFIINAAHAQKLKEIDNYLEQARIDWGVPGMSVAIVKDGEIILNKGYGELHVNKKEGTDENTLYAIASNTKAFVSSALANLVRHHKISWDDKVVEHLPYFQLYNPYVTTEITIKDLLCHRAGLGTFSGDVIWYKSEKSAREIVEKVQYVPQAYSFRDGYGYSNLMFITAGEVIKAVTGKDWNEYVRETFFDPLGMENTLTSTNDLSSKKNVAHPHKPVDEANIPIDWVNWDNMGAAGGIISSTNDMAKWLLFNLNDGIINEDTLLGKNQQDFLWTIHNNFPITENSRKQIPGRQFNGYGLGWGVYDYYGRKVVTHSGGYDGMYSRVMMMPDENLGLVVLTNSMTGITSPLMMYVINQYINEDPRDWSAYYLDRSGTGSVSTRIETLKKQRQKGTKTSVKPAIYQGSYYDPMYGEIMVTSEKNTLRLEFEDAPALSATLEHWHYDTWKINWDETHAWFDFGLISFKLTNDLKAQSIAFEVPNYDIFFHEIHAKRK